MKDSYKLQLTLSVLTAIFSIAVFAYTISSIYKLKSAPDFSIALNSHSQLAQVVSPLDTDPALIEHYAGGTFNGTSDIVTLANPGSYPVGTSFSISLWVNIPSPSTAIYGFATWGTSGNANHAVDLYYNGGIRCSFDGPNNSDGDSGSGAYVQAATWTFVTCVYDGSNFRIYNNGVLVKGPTAFTGATAAANPVAYIGAIQGPAFYMKGQISDLRIFSRALQPGEIQSLYALGQGDTTAAGTAVNSGTSGTSGNSGTASTTTVQNQNPPANPPVNNNNYTSCGTDCYQANTVSVADIQAAVDAAEATNGGVVQIPAGTATFTSQVTKNITKDLVITGAGQDKTIINDNLPSNEILAFNANGNVYFQIKSLRINQAFAGNMTFGALGVSGTSMRKLISDIYFDQTGEVQGRILMVDDPNHDVTEGGGVIFNNTFYHPGDSGQAMSVLGSYHGQSDVNKLQWDGMPQWGSPSKWYIEDNTFNFTNGAGDGAFDAYDGVRLVFRYNNVIGTAVGWHGYDSSYLSFHSAEIYKNTFTWPQNLLPAVQSPFSLNVRGGTAFVWGNTYSVGFPLSLTLSYYRSSPNTVYYGAKGRCDGTHPWDGNSDPSGYPCQQQPGMTGVNGLTPSPVIQWGNTQAGKDMVFDLNSNWVPPNQTSFPTELDHIKEGRDFLNDTTCSDGVNHAGLGINMANPVCAAFWDPVNKMAKNYTPLAYPNPLRANPQAQLTYVAPPTPILTTTVSPQNPYQPINNQPNNPNQNQGAQNQANPNQPNQPNPALPNNLVPNPNCPANLICTPNSINHLPLTRLASTFRFTRSLSVGQSNTAVKSLQIFLNDFSPSTSLGASPSFKVALKGPGSKGLESTYFGPATKRALIKFQEYYASEVLSPVQLTRGTGHFGPSTMKKVNALISGR